MIAASRAVVRSLAFTLVSGGGDGCCGDVAVGGDAEVDDLGAAGGGEVGLGELAGGGGAKAIADRRRRYRARGG
jgi:hypothetical protein